LITSAVIPLRFLGPSIHAGQTTSSAYSALALHMLEQLSVAHGKHNCYSQAFTFLTQGIKLTLNFPAACYVSLTTLPSGRAGICPHLFTGSIPVKATNSLHFAKSNKMSHLSQYVRALTEPPP
jgi:hypothetical protein